MPATVTHYLFAKDVYRVINDDTRERIKNDVNTFNLFSQGFDILFFSNKRLGHKAHNYNTNLYFLNIINYIRDNKLYNDGQCLALLYGSICHYVLDSTVHPYIFYCTGRVNLKNKDTFKYRGLHSYYEYMIDAILYKEKYNEDLYKVNIANVMFPNIKLSENVNGMLDSVHINTFNNYKGSKDVNRGKRNFKFLVKHGMSSRFGIKKLLFKLFDALKFTKYSKFANCTFYIKKFDESVLNLEHEEWVYPVDKKIKYHYSFYDLYDIAILKARDLINNIDYAIRKDEKSINKAIRDIGNLSYITGKNINNKDVMKYFKF